MLFIKSVNKSSSEVSQSRKNTTDASYQAYPAEFVNHNSKMVPCKNTTSVLPTIDKVMDLCSNSYEMSVGSPYKSTFGETCFSFDAPCPAKDEIFETRLHQLLHTLNATRSYSPYNFHQGIVYNQGMGYPSYQQVYPVYAVDNAYSNQVCEVNQPSPIVEIVQEQMESSKVSVPYEKLELKNLHKHYQHQLQPVSIKKKCEKRGRKRVNVLPAVNFSDLLNSVVLPKWSNILQKKTVREGEPIGQVTDEYLWIKVFRDMRDFYRIIFKSRFHRSEKREDSNRDVLVKIFLEELGITGISQINTVAVFDFLYKAHYKARTSNEGKKFKEMINTTPMRIYYYYSEGAKNKFLADDLCSRLLYFFLVNFGEMYMGSIQSSLQEGVMNIIQYVTMSFGHSELSYN